MPDATTLDVLRQLADRPDLDEAETHALGVAVASLTPPPEATGATSIGTLGPNATWTEQAADSDAQTVRGAPEPQTLSDDGPELPPGFTVIDLLGVGGMGMVYRVREDALRREMAVKVLHWKHVDNTNVRQRFIEEAQVSAQLVHPSIPAVHRLGVLPDGRPYFMMEVIGGRTFRDVLATNGPEHLHASIRVLQQVCEAVAYAHSVGVVHRDLKPANLMIGAFGEIIVLDWGLAKLAPEVAGEDGASSPVLETDRSETDSFQTRRGAVTGTPAYMAPEQADRSLAEIGPRSDVYALGMILYEILAGRNAYQGMGVRKVLRTILSPVELLHRAPLPEDRTHDADLVDILQGATWRDPARRYDSAKPLADALRAWIDGDAARARARATLAEIRHAPEQLAGMRSQVAELRAQAVGLRTQIPGGVPLEAKRPLWQLEDAASGVGHQADQLAIHLDQKLRLALAQAPDLDEVHEVLARFLHEEHQAAESRGDTRAAERLAARLREHDRAGAYTDYLEGWGHVAFDTDPTGAEVAIHRFVERDRRLQPEAHTTTTTPVDLRLPMGSYVAVIRAEGHHEVRYPFEITRNGRWEPIEPGATEATPVWLPPEGTLAPDERYVPAGWARFGGDVDRFGLRSMLPSRRLWVDGFAMRVHHVTVDEYIAFLNDLVSTGRVEEAMRHQPATPAAPGQHGTPMLAFEDGVFRIPPQNPYGIPWQGHWPVIFVDWFGASAYAAWKGAREEAELRLPAEYEWEKAARGVDGRRFPWGETLDPTWARMLETHLGMPTMAPAGSYEVDESVFGIRDLAGNQRDWCMDVVNPGGAPVTDDGRTLGPLLKHPHWDVRVVRGGNFLDAPLWCWASFRSSFLPYVRDYTVSFRTCRDLGPRSERPPMPEIPAGPPGGGPPGGPESDPTSAPPGAAHDA